MKLIILFVLITGVAQAQLISATKIKQTDGLQFVAKSDKDKWNAGILTAAEKAKLVTTAERKNWNEGTVFQQGDGVTLKQINDSTILISSVFPPRMSTAKRDSLNLKASRGMLIYNYDTDMLNYCNSVRWIDVPGLNETEDAIKKKPEVKKKAVQPAHGHGPFDSSSISKNVHVISPEYCMLGGCLVVHKWDDIKALRERYNKIEKELRLCQQEFVMRFNAYNENYLKDTTKKKEVKPSNTYAQWPFVTTEIILKAQ